MIDIHKKNQTIFICRFGSCENIINTTFFWNKLFSMWIMQKLIIAVKAMNFT